MRMLGFCVLKPRTHFPEVMAAAGASRADAELCSQPLTWPQDA
jgi:hypothetical protein